MQVFFSLAIDFPNNMLFPTIELWKRECFRIHLYNKEIL